jgi:hypothetical protein
MLMDITIVTGSGSFVIPVELIFWGNIAAYVVHILEESVLGEVFVEKLKKRFWAEYSWKKFFGFNTILLCLNIIAVLVFTSSGGNWIIFPLALTFERIFNGFWHLIETIVTRRYSSGLLASVLTWILGYLLIRYSFLKGEISGIQLAIAIVIGIVMTIAMLFSMLNMGRKKRDPV